MRFALANLKSLKIQNLQSGKFWNAPRLENKRPPRAQTRNTLYKRWGEAGGPPRLRGGRRPTVDARARARARALSTREVSKSRIFYKATFKSIKVKAVQLVEFGNCAKARLNPSRPRKVMIKTFFELCLKPEINDFQMGNEKILNKLIKNIKNKGDSTSNVKTRSNYHRFWRRFSGSCRILTPNQQISTGNDPQISSLPPMIL